MVGSTMVRVVAFACLILTGSGCSPPVSPVVGPATIADSAPLTPEELMRHVRILSSEDFEGREPGTSGEVKTVEYIVNEFEKAGLSSVNGGFIQDVPVRAFSAAGNFRVQTQSDVRALDPTRDFAVQAPWDVSLQNEEIVFAGYGISAPEFGHDDYGSVDVAGKVVLLLSGQPEEFPDRRKSSLEPRALDAIAKGKGTYHQWYWSKQLNAYKHGAKAVFIVSQDDRLTDRRPYFEQDYMLPKALPPWAPPLSGFWSERLFAAGRPLGDVSLDKLRALASSPRFRPVKLPLRLSGTVRVKMRHFVSHNIVGKIAGSGPECLVLLAHWDAFGRDPTARGDNVWNGAVDDAGGVAQLIEIARRLAAKRQPRRSIFFVAVTGEERGFLGSRHFVENSPCPTNRMAAALSLDWFWELGRTTDFANHPLGYSSLDGIIDRLLLQRGRMVTAENEFLAGSDQFPFIVAGIPGFHGGSVPPLIDYPVGYDEAYYKRRDAKAVERAGHSNEDEITSGWDLRGAVEDTELIRQLAWIIANDPSMPCWKVRTMFSDRQRLCRSSRTVGKGRSGSKSLQAAPR